MKRALLIGGSGQIGRAAAPALERSGFEVTRASRGGSSIGRRAAVRLDREDTAALRAAADGFDVVVDTVAYTPAHARQLLALDIGSLVVISTGSVYTDADGRYLDVSEETGFPAYPDPIAEDQPTVPDGRPAGYSADKAAMERVLLAGATPVSVLRPGAIHGPGGRAPRELFFVQRALDGRRSIPLAYGGSSRFSTSATVNIAALIVLCASSPGTRVLNAVDDETPTVAEIGRSVLQAMGADAGIVPLDGPPVDGVGSSPWGVPTPLVLSMEAAHRLGYRPAATYEESVRTSVQWIADRLRKRPWQEAFPGLVGRAEAWFAYAAEDAVLEQLG